ncbi:TIGR02679 family protein [Virgibacillus proomii]|uniref:TIGR02679 family protein n=1 Tax=Virgibacillus proomii TaxID=84407 RepID=UPI001C1095CF|nr:TIGR02679 family protein [Virgibacillus proomii]MBU5267131.1 TIGR02679 family protein [Virgibacillus proomii]
MESKLEEATSFFKSEKAYDKLFKQFRKKYESLGRIGGTVPVRLFDDDELETIASFFGISKERLQKKGGIQIAHFAEQLKETKFSEVHLKELLDHYFAEVLISKKQRKKEQQQKFQTRLNLLIGKYPSLHNWLSYIKACPPEVRWMVRLAEADFFRFENMVNKLAKAIERLPESPERLPMFSQRITGDPHDFDINADLGKMFLHVLTYYKQNQAITVPQTTEEINELLKSFLIYRDDLLNFVTCANLLAETANDSLHAVWKAAVETNTVQNIPLRELLSIKRIYPATGNHVWVVENSGVCSSLLDVQPNIPIICTHGQFKLAAFMVLDLLTIDNCTIYYGSDFDPEGLGMAERLLKRYPIHVQLWQMDTAAYKKSNPVKPIPTERLKQLERIEHPSLNQLVQTMKQVKKAGYQEALVKEMLKDIRLKLK